MILLVVSQRPGLPFCSWYRAHGGDAGPRSLQLEIVKAICKQPFALDKSPTHVIIAVAVAVAIAAAISFQRPGSC